MRLNRTALALLAVPGLLLGSSSPATADVAPPALVTTGYETSTGNLVSRDAGYSARVPGTGTSLWLFGDTFWNGGFWFGTTAALGSYTPGQVPTGLSEVPTPPAAMSNPSNRPPGGFLPQFPGGLKTPQGADCTNDGAQGRIPVSWPSGAAAIPGTNRLLVTYLDVCQFGGPTGERFVVAEYNPATNTLSGTTRVFTDLTGLSNNYARSPGSSFKPYTLIAALQQGISLDSRFPGPAHIDFPGTDGKGISNSQNETCLPQCTLTQALAKSINTIFVPLADKVGPDKVAQVAHDAGVDKKHELAEVPTITLGTSDVSPLDQAVGYATIAAQGIYAKPYIVAKVVSADGHVVYRAKKETHRAFPADVMADTTYAMTQVLGPTGTAAGKGLPGRPAAGKTGTDGEVSGNKNAWFIGFTPQLSTAVWFGNAEHNHQVTTDGAPVYGGGLPASTWQQMMTAAMQGQPVENFPPPAHVGHAINPSPTASTASPSPTATQSATTAPITPTAKPSNSLPPIVTQSPSPSPSPTSSPSGGGGGGGGGGGSSPSPPAGGG